MSENKGSNSSSEISYKDSGVDIDLAASTLKSVEKDISSTFSKDVISDLSGFAGLLKLDLKSYGNPVLVSSTDGVGTKLIIAKQAGDYSGIGQDLVGMCVNDVSCCGAKPLFFLDYIATGKIDPSVISVIIKGIAKSCRTIGVSLIGGETAEMPGMYSAGDVDVAGFCVGIVDGDMIISGKAIKENDIIIGLGSSGLHSNGYSLVRKIIDNSSLDLKGRYLGDERSLADILLEPTKLYSKTITYILDKGITINGIAHITGGGFFDNIERVLPAYLDAIIDISSYRLPEIFSFLQQKGSIDIKEMYRVFNMGIGMVMILSPDQVKRLGQIEPTLDGPFYRIGEIKKGNGKVKLLGMRGKDG